MDNTIPLQIISTVVRQFPQIVPLLSADVFAALKAAGYDGIRTVMHGAVFGSVFGYLSGGSIADARSRMAVAVSRAYVETSDVAYVEGGAELPIDPDTAAWSRAQLDAVLGYVDELFERLKETRKDGDFDAGEIAISRADGYANGLDGFYAEMKMRGSENVTLEFGGDSGKESCKDCQRLMGKRHKIKYILEHNLVPRAGNDAFECRCYNCEHYWFNPRTGEQFTP